VATAWRPAQPISHKIQNSRATQRGRGAKAAEASEHAGGDTEAERQRQEKLNQQLYTLAPSHSDPQDLQDGQGATAQ